ncbi:hypothetical protein GVM20_15650 [Porphyrobacter sp. SLTP]|uniref:hypothetical protein n=1 Tax=Porphyrobacter sp. SLTP TaxID=2683266 RepID=UPI001413318B|nr:hypothetical protein [Porphyrobacter sp. SLTP]NBB26567.1 hypothetical protein [Porphyrobacter sp. SLTP]
MLLAALHRAGLLPEARRREIVERLTEYALEFCDTSVFDNKRLHTLFTSDELNALEREYQDEWLYDLSSTFDQFNDHISSTDERGLFTDFKENMERAERHFGSPERAEGFQRLFERIEEHLDSLPDDEDYPTAPSPTPQKMKSPASGKPQDVFLDIDED